MACLGRCVQSESSTRRDRRVQAVRARHDELAADRADTLQDITSAGGAKREWSVKIERTASIAQEAELGDFPSRVGVQVAQQWLKRDVWCDASVWRTVNESCVLPDEVDEHEEVRKRSELFWKGVNCMLRH